MLSKKEVKDIQSLGHKKFRDEQELFLAEGPKIVADLLQSAPKQFQKIYALPAWATAHEQQLQNISLQIITEDELRRISQLQAPHDVFAVLRQFQWPAAGQEGKIILYLDAVQDPGNFGTLVRIADWFGIKKMVCSPGCADVYNPKVIQATMASIARVQVIYDTDGMWLKNQERPILAATLQGRSIYDFGGMEEGILLIGNESKGVRPEWLSLATEQVTIPRIGGAESLNAAVATGIMLSHLTKPYGLDRMNLPYQQGRDQQYQNRDQ